MSPEQTVEPPSVRVGAYGPGAVEAADRVPLLRPGRPEPTQLVPASLTSSPLDVLRISPATYSDMRSITLLLKIM
ncbi:hypothetical protein PG989_016504 [Apiospora arundinis]